MKKIIVIIFILLSGLSGFLLSWYLHKDEIVSQSDVYVIETFHQPVTFVSQLKGDPDAGRKIYQEFCASCHAPEPLIDVNAPRVGDKKAWKIRRKVGMKNLLKITVNGVGAMPARGGCFECSDAELQMAIQYMLHATKGKVD